MAIEAPFPELDELLLVIGEAGRRLSEIEAIEGAAGNISVYLGWPVEPRRKFPISETIELPEAVPELAGKSFMVSGSGRRLREIIQDPAANLGFVTVNEGGQAGTLYTSPRRPGQRVMSVRDLSAGKSVGGVSWRTNATGTVAHRTTSSMRRR
jgi:rhamnulose-1-phosphate aldolase